MIQKIVFCNILNTSRYKTTDLGMNEEHWVIPDPTITKK
jgi:hypothetical protein